MGEILNNYIARNFHGISVFTQPDEPPQLILHNTIADNPSMGMELTGRAVIEHNIVVGSDYGIYYLGGYFPEIQPIMAERLSISRNDFWGISKADFFAYLGGSHNTSAGEFDPIPGVGQISADPLLLGSALLPTSPCIDAGGDPEEFSGTPCVDFEGKARIIDGDGDGAVRADIGAFEYAPPAVGPGEVEGLRWQSTTQLEWDPLTGAESYSVYRGAILALGYNAWGDCLTAVPATALVESENPAIGSGFFYLVTATDIADAEGVKGSGSCVVRTTPTPCVVP